MSQRQIAAAYERAQAILLLTEKGGVVNSRINPRWVRGRDRFYYERETPAGVDYRLVDLDLLSNKPLFDPDAFALALERASGSKPLNRANLPITHVHVTPEGCIEFRAFGRQWRFNEPGSICQELNVELNGLPSPDGQQTLFCREHNLWLRGSDGRERPLTTDGQEGFAYGARFDVSRPGAHVPHTLAMPEAAWSPDGKTIATLRIDERAVKVLPLIEYAPKDGTLRPRAHAIRTALPGDDDVPMQSLVVIEVASGRLVEPEYPPMPAARMNDGFFSSRRLFWSQDSSAAYFIDLNRGETRAKLVCLYPATGKCIELFEEQSRSAIELGPSIYAPIAIHALPDSDELIWYSERSGWAHLYLYELSTGRLKRQLTDGDWRVVDVVGTDAGGRRVIFTASGRSPGNPYRTEIMSVGLDDGLPVALTSDDANHRVLTKHDQALIAFDYLGLDRHHAHGLSPSGRFVVETMGWIDKLPETVVRRTSDGEIVLKVESCTAPGLPLDWTWPELFSFKDLDGQHELWGVILKPPGFKEGGSYPVLDYAYGGPQASLTPACSFDGLTRGGFLIDATALASLGFVVVMMDGRGTAGRSRAFRDHCRGAIERASDLEDHIEGVREVARRYPQIDLNRVGVTGFSAGGYFAANAILRRGDFYSVAVAGGGNYDQRIFWATWGERFQGLPNAADYDEQAAKKHAIGLHGRLMLIHGLLDSGCHPAGMFQLVDALVTANKNFDLVVVPNDGHGMSSYATRRLWDYFTVHLKGDQPPAVFKLTGVMDALLSKAAALQFESRIEHS